MHYTASYVRANPRFASVVPDVLYENCVQWEKRRRRTLQQGPHPTLGNVVQRRPGGESADNTGSSSNGVQERRGSAWSSTSSMASSSKQLLRKSSLSSDDGPPQEKKPSRPWKTLERELLGKLDPDECRDEAAFVRWLSKRGIPVKSWDAESRAAAYEEFAAREVHYCCELDADKRLHRTRRRPHGPRRPSSRLQPAARQGPDVAPAARPPQDSATSSSTA
mmetsp:Transcript_5046/g.15857  ORF Transcript_5046/g.15857 Transcript_5046/m.15857 type:complete len:221 (+) Transcript_5046:466-1128(+)